MSLTPSYKCLCFYFEVLLYSQEIGFKPFSGEKGALGRNFQRQRVGQSERWGGFEWLESIGFLGYFSNCFHKQFEWLLCK